MTHPSKLEYNPEIGKRVREMTRSGVKVQSIFAAIQTYQYAPASLTTFYKYYRQDMESVRALTAEAVGNKVVNQALNGDDDAPNTWKARELYLRSQAGWSPKSTEEVEEAVTSEEEAESAVNAFLKALGKDIPEE